MVNRQLLAEATWYQSGHENDVIHLAFTSGLKLRLRVYLFEANFLFFTACILLYRFQLFSEDFL
jgi:hypothetical protein